jgi:hypothetical protein
MRSIDYRLPGLSMGPCFGISLWSPPRSSREKSVGEADVIGDEQAGSVACRIPRKNPSTMSARAVTTQPPASQPMGRRALFEVRFLSPQLAREFAKRNSSSLIARFLHAGKLLFHNALGRTGSPATSMLLLPLPALPTSSLSGRCAVLVLATTTASGDNNEQQKGFYSY